MTATIFYNNLLKRAFIKDYGGTASPAMWETLFGKSKKLEEVLGKDVCDFTLPEIKNLLKSFRSYNTNVLQVRASIYRTYTNYCIQKGFSKDNQNHFNELTNGIYYECVDKKKAAASYFTHSEIQEIASLLENPKDRFLLLAPYEGILGKDCTQLINLTTDDLLSNNKIRLEDGSVIEVSSLLYQTAVEAGETFEYTSSEGKSRKLKRCEYILKPLASDLLDDKMTKSSIHRKYDKLRTKLSIPAFGAVLIKNSGFLHYFNKLVEQYGDVHAAYYSSDYQHLSQRYAIKTSYSRLRIQYDEYMGILEFQKGA